MKCKDSKNLMVIRIYGSLDSQQENELDTHLQQCQECRQAFLSTQDHAGILAERDPKQEPDWDRSWQIIAEKTAKNAKIRRPLLFLPKPVLAALSLMIVFVLGFLAGKKFLFDPLTNA